MSPHPLPTVQPPPKVVFSEIFRRFPTLTDNFPTTYSEIPLHDLRHHFLTTFPT